MIDFIFSVLTNIFYIYVGLTIFLVAKYYRNILLMMYNKRLFVLDDENKKIFNMILKNEKNLQTDEDKAIFIACKVMQYALYLVSLLFLLLVLF